MTVIILYGIVDDYFIPTETSIVAAFYAFIVGLLVYKGFLLRYLPGSAIGSGKLIRLVELTNAFSQILTSEQISQTITCAIPSLAESKYLIILMINVLLMIVGTFMEAIVALIILLPPLLAVEPRVGINPAHFAISATLTLMIGLTAPPVSVCLFVAVNIAKLPLSEVLKCIWPFLLCNGILLLIISYMPMVFLWLPSLFCK